MFEETEQLIVRVVSATTGQGTGVDTQKQVQLSLVLRSQRRRQWNVIDTHR